MTKQEPIAYFAKDSDGWWAETDKESGIPLYTAPRELSDEEIEKLYYEHFSIQYTLFEDSLKFARAILKKASEK